MCEETFNSSPQLVQHVHNSHSEMGEGKSMTCPFCAKHFPTYTQLGTYVIQQQNIVSLQKFLMLYQSIFPICYVGKLCYFGVMLSQCILFASQMTTLHNCMGMEHIAVRDVILCFCGRHFSGNTNNIVIIINNTVRNRKKLLLKARVIRRKVLFLCELGLLFGVEILGYSSVHYSDRFSMGRYITSY